MCSLLVHDMYMTGKLEYSTYVYRILVRVNQKDFFDLIIAFLHTYIYVWRDAQTAHETFEDFSRSSRIVGNGSQLSVKRAVKVSRFPLFDWQLSKPFC